METTIECTECGKPIERKPNHIKKTKMPFCGFACYAKWQSRNRKGIGSKKIKVQCSNCGSEIEKQPSEIKVSKQHFCNQKCFHEWQSNSDWMRGEKGSNWRGGTVEYRGPNWNKQRINARKRDNDTCQECGTRRKNLPVHHIVPFRLFEDYRVANDLNNLITLCPSCHTKAESQYWKRHPELSGANPFRVTEPTATCAHCQKEFIPRSGASKVCDECCTATCIHCGETFYSRKSINREIKYCSRKCRDADVKRKPKTCIGCGKVFMPKRAAVRYCSISCGVHHSKSRRKSSPIT